MTSDQRYDFRRYRADYPAFVQAVLAHKIRRDELLARLANRSNPQKRRLLIRQFLNDYGIKLLYLLQSVRAKGLLTEFTPERLQEDARQLSAFVHQFEPVTPVDLSSNSGRRRRTYNFGPRKHALQRMVSDLIGGMFSLSKERHFTINGGVKAALNAVEMHAKAEFRYAIERDISQFYPSVEIHVLARLLRPLPLNVVMNVIAFAPGFSWTGLQSSALAQHSTPLPSRGLLAQGSAASPIAAEVLMAHLLEGLPDNVSVVSYADNILIQGETLDSVEAANAVLEARISDPQCGPLELKASEGIYNVTTDAFTFLGNDGEWNGNGISWRPNYRAVENVIRVIEEPKDTDEVLATARWLRNWRRGYPLWDNGDAETATYIAQLGARLAYSAPSTLSRRYSVGLGIVVEYCQSVREETGQFPIFHDLLPDLQDGLGLEGVRSRFIAALRMRLGLPLLPLDELTMT